MSYLKKLAGETALYGISSILGRLMNFLLVPFYARLLSVEDNGNITLIYTLAAFFNVAYTFGMETTYFRFANKDKSQADRIYQQVFTTVVIASILFSISIISARFVLGEWLHLEGKEEYLLLLAIIMSIDAILAIPFARLRFEGRAFYFAMAKLANTGFLMALNVFFVLVCANIAHGRWLPEWQSVVLRFYTPGNGVYYVLIANLIANALWIPMLWPILKKSRLIFQWEYVRPMLVYAYPLLFMMLAGVTNEMFSRLMLENLLPENFYEGLTRKQALAVFGNCYKLSVFMNLGIQAFRYAAEPFFFSQTLQQDATARFSQVMHWFIIVGSFVFLGISLNLEWIGALILKGDSVYMQGLHIVPVLLMANLFLGVYYNLSVWFKLTDQTYFGTWISIGGALLTVLLNYFLIPLYGFEGSSWITLAVYFLMSAACYYLGQKHYPIPYKIQRGSLYLSISVVLLLLFNWVKMENYLVMKTMQVIGTIVFFVLVIKLEKIKFGKAAR